MKIKRLIAAILLSFILVISISACGGDKDSSTTTALGTPPDNTPLESGSPTDSETQKATLPSDFNGEWEGPHDSSFNEINP